eukprot:SAG22_NODE_44_length_24912_cov_33.648894_20_plen_79_part_00
MLTDPWCGRPAWWWLDRRVALLVPLQLLRHTFLRNLRVKLYPFDRIHAHFKIRERLISIRTDDTLVTVVARGQLRMSN